MATLSLNNGNHPARWPAMVAGLLLTGLISGVSIWLSDLAWLRMNGTSALTIAIVLGMMMGNTGYPLIAPVSRAGVEFAKSRLLRAGIVLYGLRLTFQNISVVGVSGVLIDVLMMGSTFALAWWLGVHLLKIDKDTALLIGVGSSICGVLQQ